MRWLGTLLAASALVACSGNFECAGGASNIDGLGCACPRDARGDRQELARDGAGELILDTLGEPFCRPVCDRVDGRERLPQLNPITGAYLRDDAGAPLCELGCTADRESVVQRPEESPDGAWGWDCVPREEAP
ncbi:MAG: hypothetical protein AAGH15_23535 [Myxococcota bacterium]